MLEPAIVNVKYGRLRGVIKKHEDGFNYFAFKGIPYAEAPIGELRFKDPISKRQWSGIRDATKYGPLCAQYSFTANLTSDDEDCLHLNVYTKTINEPNRRKAVLVWIHGGGFMFGSCDDMYNGPDYLIRKDVVLVTIHYRLGVFGFLNLEDEIAPGNQGLKDQVMALRWVKDNIRAFGGDPNNVTIGGDSAGAVSIHYLTLSPLAKGLFHKAIAQSGVAFRFFSSITNPKQHAIELCEILGKKLTNSKEIVDYLRSLDAKVLREGQVKLMKASGSFPFGPGVDATSANPFMPIPVETAAEDGVHVPFLIGHTSCEGLVFLSDTSKEDFFRLIDKDFELLFKSRKTDILKRHNLTSQQVRRLYFKNEQITATNRDKFAKLMSDLTFIAAIHKVIKIQSERSSAPTYMYQFSYESDQSMTKVWVPNSPPGVGHFDDVAYLFKMRYFDQIGVEHPKKGSKRYKVVDQMTEMWSNFAKYGRPTIETSDLIPIYWQPIADGTILRYLNIDEDLTMQCTLNIEQKFSAASKIKIGTSIL